MGFVVAEMMVKIGCDIKDFDEKMKKANEGASTFGDTFKALLSSDIISKVFDKVVQGAEKAARAFVDFIKDVVNLYGEYEQLQGGAQLMFGEGYDYIAGKAKTAYKDVQLSQNEYLRQVNGFAIGLRESLGGNELAAAQLADRIVTAEADIVAATGNTQENVQNAFNGIMKNNFSMLDNLGLGIKASGEGMQTVIDETNKWNEAQGRATNYQMGNLADMQNALLDYIEMQGLAGYAAEEASHTIQGSLNQLKAAWENLKIGLGDPNADLNELLDNVLSSLKTATDNILPVVERALDGIADLIVEIAPKIEEAMPGLIEKLLPVIEDVIGELIDIAVVVLTDLMPEILDACQQLFDAFMETLEENTPILAGFIEIMRGMSVGLIEFFVNLATSFVEFFGEIEEKIKEKLEEIKTWISDKWEEIKTNAQEKWDSIKTAISDKWEEIKENVREKVESVRSLVTEKWENLKSNTREKWESIKSTVRDKLENLRTTAREKAESIRSSLSEKWDSIKTNAREKWESIKSTIKEKIDAIKNIFPLSIGKIFSNIKVPTISVTKGEAPFGIGGLGTKPSISIGWKSAFAKAYDNPWLIDTPTILSSMMFGDKGNYNGGEIVYGHDALMDDIREATGGSRDGAILAMLNNIYELLQEGQTITIGRRDFARLVYEVN